MNQISISGYDEMTAFGFFNVNLNLLISVSLIHIHKYKHIYNSVLEEFSGLHYAVFFV